MATGDNTDDWLLARGVGAAPPAWKPLAAPAEQVLAFAAGGRVRIVEADPPHRVLGATPPGPAPREIWWARGGRRLVTVAATLGAGARPARAPAADGRAAARLDRGRLGAGAGGQAAGA